MATKAYDYIVANIRNGKFAANEKISDRDIAKYLKISHLVVREAMSKLAEHGWIVRVPQKGSFVRNLADSDLEDIYILREVVETTAVRLLIKRITPEQLAEMKGYVEKLEQARNQNDSKNYDRADTEIHRAIVRFANSERLIGLFDSLLMQCQFTFSQVVSDTLDAIAIFFKKDFDTMTGNHRQLYEAVAEKNLERAEMVIQNHIRSAFEMTRALREFQKTQ